MYRELLHEWSNKDPSYVNYMANSKNLYEEALRSMENSEPSPEFKGNYPTLVEELSRVLCESKED